MTAYCIVAGSGDKRSLCDQRTLEDGRGVCLGRHVQAHIDGHKPAWCPTCLTMWRTATLRVWLTVESDANRDLLDRARGALQAAGMPSPHVQGGLFGGEAA